MACAILFFVSCGKETPDDNGGGTGPSGKNEPGDPIEVVDGMVTFFVDFDVEGAFAVSGVKHSGTSVIMDGKTYKLSTDADGRKTVTLPASPSNTYRCSLVGASSKQYYGANPYQGLFLPLAQFYGSNIDLLKDWPLYASYSSATGNRLLFKSGFAMIDLCLSGEGNISSVKAATPSGAVMSGECSYSASTKTITMVNGPAFAVLNCSMGGSGVSLDGGGTHFRFLIPSGAYPDGIDITVSDVSHRMAVYTVPNGTIASDQVVSVTSEYKPDEDILYYQGFDNMVWGGDYVGAKEGYSPSATKLGISDGGNLKGTEYAASKVGFDCPGSGYMESSTWSNAGGFTVATATGNIMSESYFKSRGLWDYTYLYRCQEYQGYLGVGVAQTSRGFFQFGYNRNVKGLVDATMSFDFCLKPGFNDDLYVRIFGGGYGTEIRIDGKELDLPRDESGVRFYSTTISAKIPNSMLPKSGEAGEPMQWHTLEFDVDHATSGTNLYLTTVSSSSGVKGIFIDNVTIRRRRETSKASNNLRILYWNIQYGMFCDQHNHYDNFVEFIKNYDPDICVWCEPVTVFKDKSQTRVGNSGSTFKGYLPAGWPELAARYGHKYTAIGGARDNYPQVVTSKYPIETVLKITDGESSAKPITHGAGIQRVNVNGKKINFVTVHMWPNNYAYGVPSSGQDASAAKDEGYYYREYEMDYIVSHTVNAAEYASETEWILLGDTNCRSRLDNWVYGHEPNHPRLLANNVVLDKTNLVDIIAEKYKGEWMASANSTRIDMMYASPSMYSRVRNAMILIEAWTDPHDCPFQPGTNDPSGHRPIIVDFDMDK